MNLHTNYYNTLFLRNNATDKEIKKSYYELSKEYHPDKQTGNNEEFLLISEAYKVLSDKELKKEYDNKSKYGKNFTEDDLASMFSEYEYGNNAKNYNREKYEEFINRDQLNILIYIDETFDGNIEYQRYITCDSCNGNGMGNSKLEFKNADGSVVYIDMREECEFCDKGKWKNNVDCMYCLGSGYINMKSCEKCLGKKRILGHQKLTNINIKPEDKDYKIEFMGHASDVPGKKGHLWVIRKNKKGD